jgi:dienelactone hydrolase
VLLHAWWGLNDFFKTLCDRLAAEGFVVFAPDLHHARLAKTIPEAGQLLDTRDGPAAQATAEAALMFLLEHPAVEGERVGAVGFSMGASSALDLDSFHPGDFAAIVLFYGMAGADVSQARPASRATSPRSTNGSRWRTSARWRRPTCRSLYTRGSAIGSLRRTGPTATERNLPGWRGLER